MVLCVIFESNVIQRGDKRNKIWVIVTWGGATKLGIVENCNRAAYQIDTMHAAHAPLNIKGKNGQYLGIEVLDKQKRCE